MSDSVPTGFLPGFDGLYGLEILELGDERRPRQGARFATTSSSRWASFTAACTRRSPRASRRLLPAINVGGEGKIATGLSNQTSFLRPITEGTIHATATRKHRGRTTWVWEVEMSDDQGRLCVLTRMTIAVRERR